MFKGTPKVEATIFSGPREKIDTRECLMRKRRTHDSRGSWVAFCSPAKSLTFSGFNGKPISWQKVKVLTSKQNAPKVLWGLTALNMGGFYEIRVAQNSKARVTQSLWFPVIRLSFRGFRSFEQPHWTPRCVVFANTPEGIAVGVHIWLQPAQEPQHLWRRAGQGPKRPQGSLSIESGRNSPGRGTKSTPRAPRAPSERDRFNPTTKIGNLKWVVNSPKTPKMGSHWF